MSSSGMWRGSPTISSVARRRPSGVAVIAAACGAVARARASRSRWRGEQRVRRLGARVPTAGGCERDDRPCPPARRELERDVTAERVADEVRGVDARRVQRALDAVGQLVAEPIGPSISGPPA